MIRVDQHRGRRPPGAPAPDPALPHEPRHRQRCSGRCFVPAAQREAGIAFPAVHMVGPYVDVLVVRQRLRKRLPGKRLSRGEHALAPDAQLRRGQRRFVDFDAQETPRPGLAGQRRKVGQLGAASIRLPEVRRLQHHAAAPAHRPWDRRQAHRLPLSVRKLDTPTLPGTDSHAAEPCARGYGSPGQFRLECPHRESSIQATI